MDAKRKTYTFHLIAGKDDDLIKLLAQHRGYNLSGVIRDLLRQGAQIPIASRPVDVETLRAELENLAETILQNMPTITFGGQQAQSKGKRDVNDNGRNIPDF